MWQSDKYRRIDLAYWYVFVADVQRIAGVFRLPLHRRLFNKKPSSFHSTICAVYSQTFITFRQNKKASLRE